MNGHNDDAALCHCFSDAYDCLYQVCSLPEAVTAFNSWQDTYTADDCLLDVCGVAVRVLA